MNPSLVSCCQCRYATTRVDGHWRQRRVLSAECTTTCEYGGRNPDAATCEAAAYVYRAKLYGAAVHSRAVALREAWPEDVQARIDVMEQREWWAFREGYEQAGKAELAALLDRKRV